ncbi:LOW QUALITY PROTEIN: hypothetical protein OSB04_031967 [Centaurea solstitialis]|uniref:Uncharacterized protein n=1 Tax=Centaurea solstitialis TaxID=347529 RepID=A0AA38SA25_9ASTR|nr:LOW QUALITY PROTEIN: hypothetical protein OSB04_031967 [Centaurea solstitialis]
MVRTRSEGKRLDENEDQEIPDLREMIAAKVVKQELTKVIHSRVEAAIASRASGSGGSQDEGDELQRLLGVSTTALWRAGGPRSQLSLDIGGGMMAQTMASVNEIIDLFLEAVALLSRLCGKERMKIYRYARIQKPEIREFV